MVGTNDAGAQRAMGQELPYSLMEKAANVGLARGDRKWSLDEGQIPHTPGVRVAPGTG